MPQKTKRATIIERCILFGISILVNEVSVVCGPKNLKFWQIIGLASGLIWYLMKKFGLFLKKNNEFLPIFEGTSTVV